ncbi:ferredoxin [Pseudonocardia xishanensis]|uniref:Ferredoxin n=1 Tax=Pseudonocardia xishanensis TaxID=630995 RepID=A0ABP8S3B4_9PSEU
MRIHVSDVLCESNAVCVGLAPTYFDLAADDRLVVLQEEVRGEDVEAVDAAVRRCPKAAIVLR